MLSPVVWQPLRHTRKNWQTAGDHPARLEPGGVSGQERGGPVSPGSWVNRIHRLTRSEDFKRVRRQGKSYAHPLLVLVTCPNDLDHPRIGVAAGKSVGGAVRRNRAKRLLRAVLHPMVPHILPGQDLIFMARQPLPDAGFEQVAMAVRSLVERARLMKESYVG